jgi:ABC-type antimicrobial peptide transport system permease subunit
MVVVRGMVLAIAGVAIGLVAALGAGRVLATMVFGITTSDASTFALVAAGMIAISFLACWLPARRAAATDPARILRQE